MRKAIIILLLFYAFTKVDGQLLGTNLVNNPSFEDYYSCPDNSSQLNKSKYWWGFSADYFNSCSPTIFYSVPSNQGGFQFAHTGFAYSGFFIYANNSSIIPDYRETIKTKLIDSLIANKRYCTSFYVCLAEYSYKPFLNYSIYLDSIGMLFTKNTVLDSCIPILSYGIKVQNSIFNLDTLNWLKISNSFIANGGEKYLNIGNFDNIINWPTGKQGVIYVFVDDISVCECSFHIDLGKDRTLCKGETILLNASMPSTTFLWQDGSTNSTYLVTKPGKYWVQAYFAEYNITTSDTIEIIDCEPIFIPNSFTPNGDNLNDIFKVESLNEINDFKLIIYNRWGELINESTDINKGWDGTFKNKTVPLGVYIYMLTGIIKDTGEQIKRTGSVTVVR